MWYLDQTVFDQVITLEKKHRKVIAMMHNRKARAIETVWFVTRLIEKLYPGIIEARWFGSYEEPNVAGYPKVKINAYHITSKKVLGSWEVDASGEVEPPFICADDVISDIMIGLRRLARYENF
jgi:hypothetical protein